MSQHELIAAKKKIAVARLVLRERRPPSPKLSVRLRPQHLRWEVGRYRDRIRSGPGGLGRAKIWAPERTGEQHNLILDAFYTTHIPNTAWANWIKYGAVGTGSSTPTQTQTQLDVEVARTSRPNVDFSAETRPVLSRVAEGVYRYAWGIEFTPAEVGGQNLTEWGFVPTSSGGPFVSRELFRDANNNPIALSLASDQYLRLYYAVEIQLAPLTQSISLDIAGIGVIPATFRLFCGTSTGSGSADLKVMQNFARGLTVYAVGGNGTPPSNYVGTYNLGITASVALVPGPVNNHSRTTPQAIFEPAVANTEWNFLALYYNGYGAFISFENTFVKDDLHKVIFDPWTLTW